MVIHIVVYNMLPWPENSPTEHAFGPESIDMHITLSVVMIVPLVGILCGYIDMQELSKNGASSGQYALGQMQFTIGICLLIVYLILFLIAL